MRLWLGIVAGPLLFAGIFALAWTVPGYSQVQQTVSELGEVGSPARVAFAFLLCLVAACLISFARAAATAHRAANVSAAPTWLIVAMGISAAGVGVFAYPNPLHNVFGMSELVGYQAPLAVALAFWKKPSREPVAVFSLVMYGVVLLALAANLTTLHRQGDLWQNVRPYYGLVQRSLFAAWFAWCAGYALLLIRLTPR